MPPPWERRPWDDSEGADGLHVHACHQGQRAEDHLSERGGECKIDPLRNNSPQKLPHYGKACAHLYVSGIRRVSQCHHVTK